ncbi:hypothetical protein ACK3SF_03010 [Candidatus Nanosalina sp. VS9-1]|uniref:hypothetical protein n=1 Tax=Candidatus Nanosalina sp. VS9-1 TaxID=3388566 RepID=UPI0039E01D6C
MDDGQRLFRDVVGDVKSWVPPESGENFEQSLYTFLSERVNIGKDGISRKEKTVEVKRNDERPVITVGGSIGLDIVENFSEEDVEKTSDVLDESGLEFTIVIACGVEDVEAWKEFTVNHRGTRTSDTQTDLVWKEKQFFGQTTY